MAVPFVFRHAPRDSSHKDTKGGRMTNDKGTNDKANPNDKCEVNRDFGSMRGGLF